MKKQLKEPCRIDVDCSKVFDEIDLYKVSTEGIDDEMANLMIEIYEIKKHRSPRVTLARLF